MSVGSASAGFHLLDAAALTAGYGLASLLVRAYWPDTGTPGAWEVAVIGYVFLWLGLAMSGPLVLLTRRSARSADPESEDAPPGSWTWAELAWMIIGFYWIGLTILVVPVRSHGARFLDSALLGVFPVLAALGLRFFGARSSRPEAGEATWMHRAAVALLITWPMAWMGLIVLGKTLQ